MMQRRQRIVSECCQSSSDGKKKVWCQDCDGVLQSKWNVRACYSRLLCIMLMAGCLFLVLLGSMKAMHAYYIDTVQKDNLTRIGTVDVKLQEEFDIPQDIVPGEQIQKRVWVQNTGTAPCYVRVRVIFSDSRMEKQCSIDWNQKEWIQNKTDQYFYYKNILYPGENTTDLMGTVSVSDTAKPEELVPFQIFVYAECCQAGNAASWKDAWDAFLKQ